MVKIYNSLFTKPLAILLSFCFLSWSFAFPEPVNPINLPAGTPIPLETLSLITSDNTMVGQSIDFKVIRDISVQDKVVIKAGSIARGQVMRVQEKKGLGKPGYVEIQVKSVTAVDGTEVFLTGANVYQEGEDKQTLAVVLGVLVCILFLTIKGKDAAIPPGYQITANVGANTTIDVN